MIVALVAALDENNLIGAGQGMPWHLPADLAHFKHLTLGKPVLMGRRTFESIGRALPQRDNLVLSRAPGFSAVGCRVFASPEAALASLAGAAEVMVIGGGNVYRALLGRASRMYLTRVHHRFEGDTWFPRWDAAVWAVREAREVPADDCNPYAMTFMRLERQPAR